METVKQSFRNLSFGGILADLYLEKIDDGADASLIRKSFIEGFRGKPRTEETDSDAYEAGAEGRLAFTGLRA